jgi:hypothetical protein
MSVMELFLSGSIDNIVWWGDDLRDCSDERLIVPQTVERKNL